MAELAYVNGTFCSLDQAKVSIEDRGFQFGDGVYEAIVSYGGRPFLLKEHIERLKRSAAAIRLDYDFAGKPLEPIIEEGIRRSELSDALIYLQLTRGAAPRSHVVPPGITPTVVMTFKPAPIVPDELRRRGARVMTVPDDRWANCFVKAITLLPNVLARNEAVRQGFDDAVFVAPGGEVRECTSSNVFIVKNGCVSFPLRTHSVLHGVTQGFLTDCAKAIGLKVREEVVLMDTLRAADEVFMSSTAVEILAITSVDGRPIGDGKVGASVQRLFQEFRRRSRS